MFMAFMEESNTANIFRLLGAIVHLGRRAYGPYKRQILILTVLGFVGGILEGIGINAVIPLLTFVLGLHNPATDMLSLAIQGFFTWIHVPFVPKFLLTFIVVLFIGKALVSLGLSYIQIGITTEYERSTRSTLFKKVLRASWPYLLRQKLGNLETALMIDTPAATALLSKISFSITVATSLVMYLVVAFSISAPITLTTFGLGAIVFISLRPFTNRVHAFSRERASLFRDTAHHVTEHVGGLKTVKALGVEISAIERGFGLFSNIKRLSTRIQMLQQISAQAMAPIGIMYIAAILALAFKTPFISLAALPAILYLIHRIFTYIQQLQMNVQYISELVPHLERVINLENSAQEWKEETSGSLPFSFRETLSFDNVSFSYQAERLVLRDVSFSIPKGSMVGIVGPSGAGKTTCVDLMLRLLEPSLGAILLDGIDTRGVVLSEWRRKVGYVSQDLFLIQDTIRNNIRFYDESISDEDIWEAARSARIDEFIRKSPQGLDTQVGDRGIMISAGERQRIVIARTLARKPELLILDEATSSLDNESEAHIKRVIEELKGNITIIAIAHRLSTIMDSDTLIVLSEGRVMETGSPKELLANTGSYFYKVYTISQ